MKKLTQLMTVASIAASGCGAAFAENVVVESVYGQSMDIPLTVDTKIVFSKIDFTIDEGPDGVLNTFDYTDVARIRFTGVTNLVESIVAGSLRLASNPVAETLVVLGHESEPASCTVTDLNGKTIYSSRQWSGETIDVSTLTPGLYFVTINSTTLKFIKK